MFQGDSLQVLLFFVALAVSGLMGAISAPSGWRSNSLWALTGIFTVAALVWVVAPAASPFVAAVGRVVSAIMATNVWLLVATVGVVALMLGRRQDRTLASEGAPVDADQKQREHQRVVQALDDARQSAVFSMADVTPSARERTAERELPLLNAALLSAQKLHGIPRPPYIENAVVTVELHCRFVEQILPLLRAGHVDEARQSATDLVSRLTPLAEKKKV